MVKYKSIFDLLDWTVVTRTKTKRGVTPPKRGLPTVPNIFRLTPEDIVAQLSEMEGL